MRYDFQTSYNEQFSYLIDNQKYQFKVILFNPEGDSITLNKSAVMELTLNDVIFEPWVKGKITLDNTGDALERFVNDPTDSEFYDVQKVAGYTFRGDGRDFIKIEIIPLDDSNEEYDQNSNDFNSVFGLRYIFAISNESNGNIDDTPTKTYNIVDYDLEILKERSAFFNSTDLIETENADIDTTQLSNKQREVFTGKCLKDILRKGLNDPNSIFTDTESASADYTPFFENGSSLIFYASPGNYNAYDDIMYILKRHVSGSTISDFSFLKKQNNSGEYTLESASKIFNKAYDKERDYGGSKFLEKLTITGGSKEDDNIVEKVSKGPANSLTYGEKGDILIYNFFNTSPKIYKEKIKSQVVSSYNFKDKKFNLNFTEGNITAAKDVFTQGYVRSLKGKDDKPFPNMPLTVMQTSNYSYDSVFSEYGENETISKSYGINKLLKNALITNLGVELLVKGQLSRKSGNFISIEREGDYLNSKFDNKFLGIYFILEVMHEFINDTEFYNRIVAVKTYHYEDPNFREDLL